jgi:hypothetical protein
MAVTVGSTRAHRRLGLAMQDEGEYTARAGLAQERSGRVCCIERSQVIFAGRFTVNTYPAHPSPPGEASSVPQGGKPKRDRP